MDIVDSTESEVSVSIVVLTFEAPSIHLISLCIQLRPTIKNSQSFKFTLHCGNLFNHFLVITIWSINQTSCWLWRSPYGTAILFVIIGKCRNPVLCPKHRAIFYFLMTHWTRHKNNWWIWFTKFKVYIINLFKLVQICTNIFTLPVELINKVWSKRPSIEIIGIPQFMLESKWVLKRLVFHIKECIALD